MASKIYQTPILTTQSLTNCTHSEQEANTEREGTYLHAISRPHNANPVDVLIHRRHRNKTREGVVRMHGKIFTCPSRVGRVGKGDERSGHRVEVGCGLRSILRDERRQQVELRGVVVDRRDDLATEQMTEIDERLVRIKARSR